MRTSNRRNVLLGRIHQLAKSMRIEEGDYRTILMCHTGKLSCKELGAEALEAFWRALEHMARGEVPSPARGALIASHEGLAPAECPTPKQWVMLEGLARAMGWTGLRDPRLIAFVQRTTAESALEYLTRREVSACLTGLMLWRQQIKAKKETLQ